ncbi:MAG: TIGR03013 family PEP-CTERM/XrtA system glycosyltransferase [Desulfobacteraceae bacterium]|nr:TIGR03013 family PEP-CTERM/XrtA system glycosyltransferase [Desulfobacteraceae bacterium]MBC2754794.1 TIGR03013 family PEP-CTERM/XrtA system glycosyltransferase [Desulfobacteraceae bacterium]
MPHLFKKYYPWRNLLFVLGEGTLIFLIINSVLIFWIGLSDFQEFLSFYVFRALVVTFVFQLCFYYFDLYDLKIIPSFPDHMLQVLQTLGFACIVLAFIYFLFPFLIISTRVFWCILFAAGLAVFFWRFLYFKILERRMFIQTIALIGTGKFAGEIVSAIEKKKDSGFKIVTFVGDKTSPIVPEGLPVFSEIKELRELCEHRAIGKIVVALDEKRGVPLHELIQYKFLGIEILGAARFYEELTGTVPVERVNPSWLVFSEGFYVGRMKRMLKRTIDIVAALTVLLIFLPVFAASALIIKLGSPGGIFYRQERVGENGKSFNIIKFRSMKKDAEKNGPIWASTDDDRATKFGRFIRKTRIDELPQLINVLKGNMSFVGPRPERPVFVKELEKKIPFYSNRHVVKPGITGWAQIYYPYGASVEDALRKLEYDLYYIKNLSIAMDLLTIFHTIKVVLFHKGAR